jgi:hypothetical protein
MVFAIGTVVRAATTTQTTYLGGQTISVTLMTVAAAGLVLSFLLCGSFGSYGGRQRRRRMYPTASRMDRLPRKCPRTSVMIERSRTLRRSGCRETAMHIATEPLADGSYRRGTMAEFVELVDSIEQFLIDLDAC